MKRTAILICLLLLVATPARAQRFWLVPAPGAGGPTALYFDDDVVLGFGNTSAAPDCWEEWDTAGTDDFELKCTDVNGAGTDGIIFSVDTGTDDVVFVGNVSTVAGTMSAEQLTSTDDANVTGTCTCGDVSSGAVTSSATVQGEQVTSTDDGDINDSLIVGDLVIDEAAGVLNFTGATSATISSTSGSVYVPDLKWSPGSGPADATLDERGLTCGARTTDSGNPAQAMVINSEDLYPFATQSSTAASNLILRGGLDAKQFGVLDGLAGCTGADYARAVYSVAGATATTTTCTYGTNWCSGVGADTCANATEAAVRLALCLDAGTGIGATASGAICPGGAANSRCVGVSADRLTVSVAVSNNDDTCVVDGNGTDGTIVVPDGTAAMPGICLTTQRSGLFLSSGVLGISTNATARLYVDTEGIFTSSASSRYGLGQWVVLRGVASGVSSLRDYNETSGLTFYSIGQDIGPYPGAAATDIAPATMTVTTQEPFANVALADQTNKTGGNLTLATANGSRRLANAGSDLCTGADPCAVVNGTTITFPVQVDGVTTNCVVTHANATAAATREFHCNGHTAVECAGSIITSMSTISPCTLITPTAATNGVLGFKRVAGSTSYLGPIVVSTGAAEIVAENGTNGAVNIPGVRVVTGADTACTTTCGANRGCLFGQNTAALTYAIVACSDATADVCVCLGGA